ncbi:hypothetical protein BH10PLA1_BH10PLA1_02480 [soil metagenome]
MIRTLYVIHHSHTDIGYTHGQSKIVRWHGQFIRQAMALAEKRADFAWTCETFYPVEQFWAGATADERSRFIAAVKKGGIGLTAGYLHFNDLPDAPLLESLAARAKAFGDAAGVPISAAMSADVNGVARVEAQALAGAGVKLLYTCVHTHHGYVPFGERQKLFKWDMGDGKSMVVFHGDHYHVGNDLGLSPGADSNYCTRDAVMPEGEAVMERRLPAYLKRVEESGWPHDFLVVAVSGMITDNGPPSLAIAERIARWNEKHSSEVRVEMTTLQKVAEKCAAVESKLPTFAGDWTDWWADGVAGDPEAVALFRQAQRDRRFIAMVNARNVATSNAPPKAQAASSPGVAAPIKLTPIDLTALDNELSLFAEHTFGHSAAMGSPWAIIPNQLRLTKLSYAGRAADIAERMIDEATDTLGGGAMAYDRPLAYRVTNPGERIVHDVVNIEFNWGELQRWKISDSALRVVRLGDKGARQTVIHQKLQGLRGPRLLVDLTLAQGETVDLLVESAEPAVVPAGPINCMNDQLHDIAGDSRDVKLSRLKTDHVSIEWTSGQGITSWKDAATGRELIDQGDAAAAPFTLFASRLPEKKLGPPQRLARQNLGRNRNAAEAVWATSRLTGVLSYELGALIDRVELDYAIEGFEIARLRLGAWKTAPRVDVEVIVHKTGTWDSENVYLALPFTAAGGERSEQLWLDRGAVVRPGKDQLPATLTDFYGVQDGLGWTGKDLGVAIAQYDSHLIQLGDLGYGVRGVAGKPGETQGYGFSTTGTFAWLMTNYWETNFAPELGGFYSFRYAVLWGSALRDAELARQTCRDATTGLRLFPIAGPTK